MPEPEEVYIGDGVHVFFDGDFIRLRVKDGETMRHEIALGQLSFTRFIKYVKRTVGK